MLENKTGVPVCPGIEVLGQAGALQAGRGRPLEEAGRPGVIPLQLTALWKTCLTSTSTKLGAKTAPMASGSSSSYLAEIKSVL